MDLAGYGVMRLAILCVLLLLLMACTPTQITADLNTIVTAVSLALPILSLAGVPPLVITATQGYLSSVSVAVEQTVAELASQDTGPVKASKVAGFFAGAIIPNLPPGTKPMVEQLLRSVSTAVAGFVAHFAGGPGFAAQATAQLAMTRGDKQQLDKIGKANAHNIEILSKSVGP